MLILPGWLLLPSSLYYLDGRSESVGELSQEVNAYAEAPPLYLGYGLLPQPRHPGELRLGETSLCP